MRFPLFVLCLTVLAACATSATRPAEIARADVSVALRAPLMFGSSRTAQAPMGVTVTNTANVPVTVRRIRLSSPAMMDYEIRPVSAAFNDLLAPNASKTFVLLSQADAARAGLDPAEPLNVRAEVDFVAGKYKYREVFNVVAGTLR